MYQAIDDASPELGHLGELIAELLDEGAAPPDDPNRITHQALFAFGELLELSRDEISDDERAFRSRTVALRCAAELIVAVTDDPGEMRLIREDLMADMRTISSQPAELVDPRHEAAGLVLWIHPHLASISETLLRDPRMDADALSRSYVLEDVCRILTGLLSMAWRLRAWASTGP